MVREFTCCLCGKTVVGYGNNPAPVVTDDNSLCCDDCNMNIVLATRLGIRPVRKERGQNNDN